ncbi:hypothetical protein SNE510_44410 [Streptomyces sp. NE5-10]|uniref:hypothetical protein n=1 Tax=Streptomyces sp. NE5-10 TaxID=2759674 RepID=UPI001905F232|nr:hypothetical protein [Streptomyces sp. NE5-10]GHJ94922.1 hypothetical protein SNE510_44410 [Streptomyces sp. NE5-10]
MNTSYGSADFTLHHTDPEGGSRLLTPAPSWAGSVPGLGGVHVRYGPAPGRSDAFAQVSVAGEGLPAGVFSGIRYGHAPLPSRARLQVGAHTGAVSRFRSGLTRDQRALRVRIDGRAYRYRQGPGKCVHELLRPGLRIRVTRDDWYRPLALTVRAEGPADGLDLSLALLLQGVYTRHLSQGGRWFSLPFRILNRMPDVF